MLTYFRVLKRRPPPPALFPAVMEGLAKFVHLVNLDTVQDLLDLLKDLLTEVSASDTRIVENVLTYSTVGSFNVRSPMYRTKNMNGCAARVFFLLRLVNFFA